MTPPTAFDELLERLGACIEARQWVRETGGLAKCWAACQQPNWMLWLLNRLDLLDGRRARLFACRCVRETPTGDGRTVWDLLTDPRSRTVVEVAERYAEGNATTAELVTTLFNALGPSWHRRTKTFVADRAAWSAASRIMCGTLGLWDVNDAEAGAREAADAAAWAATGETYDARLIAARTAQCDIIRRLWPKTEVVAAARHQIAAADSARAFFRADPAPQGTHP